MNLENLHSRDADVNQRLWKALGYGGKTGDPRNWRYWPMAGSGPWTIMAPCEAAEYRQEGKKVYYQGKLLFEAATQWEATRRAIAHFYTDVWPTLLPLVSISAKNQ
jgi:hypothetical protein